MPTHGTFVVEISPAEPEYHFHKNWSSPQCYFETVGGTPTRNLAENPTWNGQKVFRVLAIITHGVQTKSLTAERRIKCI